MDALNDLVTNDSYTDCHAFLREANDFTNTIKKKDNVAKGFGSQISNLHRAVQKGKLNNF